MPNRAIKFRVWDVNKKEMCYDVDVHSGKLAAYVSIRNHSDNCKDEKIIDIKNFLMQFTGLHDKTGNEIWEGDILECVIVKSLFPGVAHLVKYFGTSKSTKIYSEARRLYLCRVRPRQKIAEIRNFFLE